MKNLFFPVAFAMVLSASAARAEVIELDVFFEEPKVWSDEAGYSHLEQASCLLLGRPGEPQLPVRSITLALPPDHRSVSVEVTAPEWIKLPGYHVLFPVQPPRPLSLPGPFPFREPQPEIYLSAASFPPQPVKNAVRQFLHGFSLLQLELLPVVYHPAEGRLEWAPVLHVKVVTGPQSALEASGRMVWRGREQDLNEVRRLVANPELLALYSRPRSNVLSPDYRYLIITTQALAACSGSNTLNTLLQSKQARGIPARMETLESIRSAYSGTDDAAKIREFIKDMYQNHGAQFALLVGDADGQVVGGETQAPVIPVRYLWGDIGSGVDQLPSDLYYGALDGNFDANGVVSTFLCQEQQMGGNSLVFVFEAEDGVHDALQ